MDEYTDVELHAASIAIGMSDRLAAAYGDQPTREGRQEFVRHVAADIRRREQAIEKHVAASGETLPEVRVDAAEVERRRFQYCPEYAAADQETRGRMVAEAIRDEQARRRVERLHAAEAAAQSRLERDLAARPPISLAGVPRRTDWMVPTTPQKPPSPPYDALHRNGHWSWVAVNLRPAMSARRAAVERLTGHLGLIGSLTIRQAQPGELAPGVEGMTVIDHDHHQVWATVVFRSDWPEQPVIDHELAHVAHGVETLTLAYARHPHVPLAGVHYLNTSEGRSAEGIALGVERDLAGVPDVWVDYLAAVRRHMSDKRWETR